MSSEFIKTMAKKPFYKILKFLFLSFTFPFVSTIVFFLSNSPTIPFVLVIKIIALPVEIITIALMCCFLSYVIYFVVSLILIRSKSIINTTAFVIILNFAGILCGIFLNNHSQNSAFNNAAINGERITTALRKYHSEHDAYPNSLKELVPKYLPSIPKTGLRRYPVFEYEKEVVAERTGVEGYEIRITFVHEMEAWTYLLYRSGGKCPDYCDPVSRGWMYCIEDD